MRSAIFIILSVLSIIGTLWFQGTLNDYQMLELGVTLVLIVIALLTALGMFLAAGWSWPLAILFFAGSITNLSLIYWSSREAFLPFLVLLAWNVVALMFASMRAQRSPLSLYAMDEPINLENIMPIGKRSRARTAKRAKKARSKKSKGRKR
ncbi:hypothetical protein HY492_01170 [Candidatus Woesearchaeota archaeon]|nr:hypothetical protein [Candidatus Woesearchaeota archaeon]